MRETAPGYFVCNSRDDEGRTCGHRIHISAGGPMTESCSCGTFAIGRCASCGASVCGDHSELYEGRRLCSAHWADEYRAAGQRAAAQEKRAVDGFDGMLDSFIEVASKRGNSGLNRFRLCPDRGWKGRASDRGWLILGTRHYAEGTAGTYYLLPDRSVTIVVYTVRYISSGYQQGHHDPKLRRSDGMRSGFRDPVFIQPHERATKLRPHWEEIAESLRALAEKHQLDWAATPVPGGV